ncbi:hypothetical protein MA16_Dca020118 [Dendrobium catenatum]|uniref:Uncharacterized protein n=1 Tax=Dendrobium catenatum TaxID=906689 RepID=A0A2I0WET0_9ASPA|nr:hypothetical protein MA16_Dca020118 [Dendrobium catenatum]
MALAERRKRLEAEKKGGKNSQVSPRDRRRRSGQSSQAFPNKPAGYGFQKSHFLTSKTAQNIYYL